MSDLDEVTNDLDAIVTQLLKQNEPVAPRRQSVDPSLHRGAELTPSWVSSPQLLPRSLRMSHTTCDGRHMSSSRPPLRNGGKADALLRRFTRWQERKDVKRLRAVYTALLEEQEACPFTPDRRPESLLRQAPSVIAKGLDTGSDARHPRRTVGQSSVRSTSGTRLRNTHTWESLLQPSPLYAGNVAWGEETFLARMAAGREERERPQREEEVARCRYVGDEYLARGPTIPQVFHLGGKNGVRDVGGNAVGGGHKGRGRFDDMDSFAVMGPRIRQSLIFANEMTSALEQATRTEERLRQPITGTSPPRKECDPEGAFTGSACALRSSPGC